MNKAITVAQAAEAFKRIKDYQRDHMTLAVNVFRPRTIAGTPRVAIIGMQASIDWDSGAMLLKPARQLTELTPEQVEAIMRSARLGLSWHSYQAQKSLRDQIQDLENDRDKYRAAFMEWIEKTEWVQQTAQPKELGKHRADIMLDRIRALEAKVATLKQGGV